MHDFLDKMGRTIRISINTSDAWAHHDGKLIGRIETTG